MAKKLFAMEELDENLGTADLEVSPEEGEVADVAGDVNADVGDISETASGVDEGIEAAGTVEEVETLVEDSIENGDGLNEVAAEAIRIALESACSRVGANPKRIYSLYATENFSSASSRKANTRIALEGIKDFLVSLWDKIKSTLDKMWTKIGEFWNKYMSSLNRVQKALVSMKERVSKLQGTPKDDEDAKAGSSLESIFPVTSKSLSADNVKEYIVRHKDCKGNIDTINTLMSDFIAATTSAMTKLTNSGDADTLTDDVKSFINGLKTGPIEFGDEKAPLAGGVYVNYTIEVEDLDNKEETVGINIEKDSNKVIGETSISLEVASKDEMKNIISDTINHLKDVIKLRDKSAKIRTDYNKAKNDMDKAFNTMKNKTNSLGAKKIDIDKSKELKRLIRAFSLINSKLAPITPAIASYDVTLGKGVLSFCSASMKYYKK